MQKRSGNGTVSKHSKADLEKRWQLERGRAFYVDGQLDADAYFEFLEDYLRMFPEIGRAHV